MSTLKKKIVLITGASSGIGKACAEKFAAEGANLILTARRFDRLQSLSKNLIEKYSINTLPLELDVRDANAVTNTLSNLPIIWQQINILLNNAGLALTSDKIQDADPRNWDIMIDTNMKGLLYVTRAILPGMIARNNGHIINIGSVAGHDYYPNGNVYCATKHAVRAISHSLRLDLLGTPIRVSSVDPGAVETEFSEVRWQDKDKAKEFYKDFTPLVAEDIADAVVYCATRPAHVNIAEMVVFPTDQASVHHINRK